MLDPAPTSTVTDRLCGSLHRSTADQPYLRCQPANILTVTGVHENQHPSQFCYIMLHYFSPSLTSSQFWKGHKGDGLLLMQHIAYFISQSSLMLSIQTNDTTKSIHMIQMTVVWAPYPCFTVLPYLHPTVLKSNYTYRCERNVNHHQNGNFISYNSKAPSLIVVPTIVRWF